MDSFNTTQMVVTLVIRVRASRALSFTPLFSTRTSCWRNTVSTRMRQYSPFSYHQRFADADTPYVQRPVFAAVTT
jgi:hypothetical protein